MLSDLRLGRAFGARLLVDWTVVVIFLLVVSNLALGLFPFWHPEWTAATTWLTALAAGLLFFASILVHELAHTAVARARGIPVRSVTLFLFGGVSDIEREPPSPGTELLMAIVGPIASVALGLICVGIAALSLRDVAAPGGAIPFTELSPVATLLVWLGPINVFIGVFNMLPAYPLDGGRVLRAIVWRATDDLLKATRVAARAGQIIAGLIAAVGATMLFGVVYPVLGGGFLQGLWLIFLAWFLGSVAGASYRRVVAKTLLEDVPVTELMRQALQAISADMTLQELVGSRVLAGEQSLFAVRVGSRIGGFVSVAAIRAVPWRQWGDRRVGDIMTPLRDVVAVQPHQDAYEALKAMGKSPDGMIPVVDHGEVLGLVHRTDIAKWVSLQSGDAP